MKGCRGGHIRVQMAMTTETAPSQPAGPPIPRTFWEYIRSFGPGIIIVLTWLGAGDIVDMGVAGSNYGYALMWMLIVVLFMRFLFVSLIARYQLCNQHGEGVLDGLARLNPLYAPFILGMVFLLGHFYCAYLMLGASEVLQHLTGRGTVVMWAVLISISSLILAFQPFYRVLEWVFLLVLLILSVSFIGTALWVGFDPKALMQGMYRVEMPGEHGKFSPLLVGVAMIGAVGGSLMNLAYPYFLDAKGWKGPQYRKVQFYDFLLGVIVMIVLNLAVWILGAELLHPKGITISTIHDLPQLLVPALGNNGRVLLYVGIFAACYTSIIGKAVGLGYMGAHAWLRWQAGTKPITDTNYRKHRLYPIIAAWCVVTPLIWPILGKSDFVALTLAVNSAQVVFLPLLAGGLWWITASSTYIGPQHKNRWWENVVMAFLFALALWGAYQSVGNIIASFNGASGGH